MSFVKMQRKRCWQWPFVITTIEPRRDRAKLQYTLYIYIILSSFTFEKSVVFLSCAIFLALFRSGLSPWQILLRWQGFAGHFLALCHSLKVGGIMVESSTGGVVGDRDAGQWPSEIQG